MIWGNYNSVTPFAFVVVSGLGLIVAFKDDSGSSRFNQTLKVETNTLTV